MQWYRTIQKPMVMEITGTGEECIADVLPDGHVIKLPSNL